MNLSQDEVRDVLEKLGFEVDANYKFKMRPDEKTSSWICFILVLEPKNDIQREYELNLPSNKALFDRF